MKKRKAESISIVIPTLNEESNIDLLYGQLVREVKRLGIVNYEIIFSDNGSSDNTLEIIKYISRKDMGVKLVKVSKKYDKDLALFKGIEIAAGDLIITMDSDLQHPPREIKALYKKWQNGYDVINAIRTKEAKKTYKKILSFAGYSIFKHVFKVDIRSGDFKLIDKQVRNKIIKKDKVNLPYRVIISKLSARSTNITYDVPERKYGITKYPLPKLIKLFMNYLFALMFFKAKRSARIN